MKRLVVPKAHAQPRSSTATQRGHEQQGALPNAPTTAAGATLVEAVEAKGQHIEREQQGPYGGIGVEVIDQTVPPPLQSCESAIFAQVGVEVRAALADDGRVVAQDALQFFVRAILA